MSTESHSAKLSPALLAKLSAIMGDVGRLPKDGHNSFHHYDYTTESQYKAVLNPLMVKHGVILLVDQQSMTDEVEEREGKKGVNRITKLQLRYCFADAETGDVTPWCGAFGSGIDTGDKGCYKAITGAIKYILATAFLIPTGEDPEGDNPKADRETGKRAAAAVGKQRVADLEAQQAARRATEVHDLGVSQADVKTALEANGNWFKTMLRSFQEIKDIIGTTAYYKVLGANGYEHTNELPNRDIAKRVYREMGEIAIANKTVKEGAGQ